MEAPQPINEWFGNDPFFVPPPPKYTREMRQRAKEAIAVHEDPPKAGISEDEEWFRHFNWRDKRKSVHQALADAGATPNTITAFENCGADCQVEWSEELQRYRVCACYCHSRHCEPCMKAKAALITNNLRERMKGIKQGTHHFITLTLAHAPDQPLRPIIARLYAAYKRLRNTDEWKYGQMEADKIASLMRGNEEKQIPPITRAKAVSFAKARGQLGGAATLEIKWSKRGGWHAHLHIISEGSNITNHRLKDLWYEITTDSWECDCRTISAEKDVAFYVGKYVTKGTNNEVWDDPAVAAEYVRAIKGVRMCATFGTWRGYKLLKREKEKPGQWKSLGSLAEYVRRAQDGEVHALNLLRILVDAQQYNPNRKRRLKPK
jgi:hypothetical protein